MARMSALEEGDKQQLESGLTGTVFSTGSLLLLSLTVGQSVRQESVERPRRLR